MSDNVLPAPGIASIRNRAAPSSRFNPSAAGKFRRIVRHRRLGQTLRPERDAGLFLNQPRWEGRFLRALAPAGYETIQIDSALELAAAHERQRVSPDTHRRQTVDKFPGPPNGSWRNLLSRNDLPLSGCKKQTRRIPLSEKAFRCFLRSPKCGGRSRLARNLVGTTVSCWRGGGDLPV
jgi:hypothetical protein